MYAPRLRLTCAAACVALLCCACAHAVGSVHLAEAAPTFVTVQNDNWLDVTVYAVHGTERVRLGMVTGPGRATLRLPRSLGVDGTVRLLADPVGSPRTYLTDVIRVDPGQRIEFRVGSVLSMSSFALWNR